MRYGIGSIICLLLLSGCGNGERLALKDKIDKEKTYYKNLQKSEKIQFYEGNVTKALFTATYLFRQSIDKNDERDEKFIIGMFTDEESSEVLGKDYLVTLDGMSPLSIQPLDEHSEYLKEIPVVTEWTSYYLVRFPHISKKNFYLTFISDAYGQKQMHFAKVAKYVISKKAY